MWAIVSIWKSLKIINSYWFKASVLSSAASILHVLLGRLGPGPGASDRSCLGPSPGAQGAQLIRITYTGVYKYILYIIANRIVYSIYLINWMPLISAGILCVSSTI
jgi:hypothetical protein